MHEPGAHHSDHHESRHASRDERLERRWKRAIPLPSSLVDHGEPRALQASGGDFFVMIIVGPNARNDFHQVNSEEFFLQLKGDIVVKTIENGRVRDNVIKEGEVFFIPPNVIHSPRRGPDTIGLVVEKRRPDGESEHLIFYCEKCETLVHDKVFDCKDIVQHFAQAMEDFWADTALCTCKNCGHVITKPRA